MKQPLSATRKSFTSHRVESNVSPYFREGRMGILWRLEQTQCRCCKHQLCITKCPYYHHIVEMMLIVVIIPPTHAPTSPSLQRNESPHKGPVTQEIFLCCTQIERHSISLLGNTVHTPYYTPFTLYIPQNVTATMASMAMPERPVYHHWTTKATVLSPFCLQRRPGQFCGRTTEAERSQPLCKGGIK